MSSRSREPRYGSSSFSSSTSDSRVKRESNRSRSRERSRSRSRERSRHYDDGDNRRKSNRSRSRSPRNRDSHSHSHRSNRNNDSSKVKDEPPPLDDDHESNNNNTSSTNTNGRRILDVGKRERRPPVTMDRLNQHRQNQENSNSSSSSSSSSSTRREWGPPKQPNEESASEKGGPNTVVEKQKFDLGTSGKLASIEQSNEAGTQVKYNEPADARKPNSLWRFYVFKDGKQIEMLHIHRSSYYLIGRDPTVCHIVQNHPSISKQHAVVQFRQKASQNIDGTYTTRIKPYIIDLGSTNGTLLGGKKLDALRYYELLESDVVKFGLSTREFVLLHAGSTEASTNLEHVELPDSDYSEQGKGLGDRRAQAKKDDSSPIVTP